MLDKKFNILGSFFVTQSYLSSKVYLIDILINLYNEISY